jgi:hypothetical protein
MDGSGFGVGAVVVDAADVAASGIKCNFGLASVSAVPVTISAISVVNGTGTVNVLTQVVDVYGVAGSTATGVFTGLSVNTRAIGVAEYTGLAINSMCLFNGMYLAATSSAIVELTGTTDSGVLIQSKFKGGFTNFGNTNSKRLVAGYTSLTTDGELSMSLQSDDNSELVYRIVPRSIGKHTAKVRFGLGVRGIQWRLGLYNNGNDFRINNVALDVESLGRRIL